METSNDGGAVAKELEILAEVRIAENNVGETIVKYADQVNFAGSCWC